MFYTFNVMCVAGGNVVDNVDTADVLVMNELRRTLNVLCAIGRGLPICSSKWITVSKEAGKLLGL